MSRAASVYSVTAAGGKRGRPACRCIRLILVCRDVRGKEYAIAVELFVEEPAKLSNPIRRELPDPEPQCFLAAGKTPVLLPADSY